MKVKLIVISDHPPPPVAALCSDYEKRLKNYTSFELVQLAHSRKKEVSEMQQEEGERLLRKLQPQEHLVLLDERGDAFTSETFATFISRHQQTSVKYLCFAIGGAYGFSEQVYARAVQRLSLSKFTLPHMLARVVFTEQLYRAFTILKGEKYHHG